MDSGVTGTAQTEHHRKSGVADAASAGYHADTGVTDAGIENTPYDSH